MKKVIAVMGSTAVGKSKLAIDLAKALQAEVINCDALQIYDSMPVATNKVTEEEMAGVPHHLMSYVPTTPHYKDEPGNKDYTVIDFVNDSQTVIQQVQLPIVVGGTHYWLQQLLLEDNQLETVLKSRQEDSQILNVLQSNDQDAIYEKLFQVDPVMANRWHRNDHRKIRRSLEVFAETGQRQSQLLYDQHARLKARFPSLIFWLYTEPQALEVRTTTRISDMFQRGLLQEIIDALDKTNSSRELDFTYGVYQGIGIKELHSYIVSYKQDIVIDSAGLDQNRVSDKVRLKLWNQCIQRMQITTRVLAKMQVKWIKQKLLPICHTKVPVFMVEVNESSLSNWQETVLNPSIAIARKFLNNEPLPVVRGPAALRHLLDVQTQKNYNSNRITSQICDVCKIPVIVQYASDFDAHLQSKRHKAEVSRPIREAKRQLIKQLYHR